MKIVHKMIVYRQDTQECMPREKPGVEFARLDENEILEQGAVPTDIYRRQVDRLHRFGASYCLGAFVNERLAAFAWLIPHDLMRRDVPHILQGKPGEAELTAGETLPEYRGQGLHGYIMVNGFAAARADGIASVLFKTYPGNVAALRSFDKIGARKIGATYFARVPWFGATVAWPRRFG